MPSSQETVTKALEIWKQDPGRYFDEVLGIKAWSKQVEIAEAVRDHREVVVAASKGVGKTYITADIMIWFLQCFPPAKVISTAPTERQVRDLLWSEINMAYGRSKVQLQGRPSAMQWKVMPDWYATGFSTKEYDPDKFSGYHAPNVLVVFDEGCGVNPGIWEAAEGLMTSANVHWLVIGNCTDIHSDFYRACKPGSGWHKIKINAFDTPNVKAKRNIYPSLVSYDYPARMAKKYGKDSRIYTVMVEGKFWTKGTDAIIPMELVEQAENRDLPATAPWVIGLDVAGMGSDKNVWVVRGGARIVDIQRKGKADAMAVCGRTVKLVKKWQHGKGRAGEPVVNIDVIGMGWGIYGRLKELGVKVVPVNVGKKARNEERYPNLRSEIGYALADRFREERICVDRSIPEKIREAWKADMVEVQTGEPSAGRDTIEPKAKTKKRLGRSPDYYDATALAFADVRAKGTLARDWAELIE